MKKKAVATKQTHLVDENGAPGPRADVVIAMFERMLEWEEEVARGERIPQYVEVDGKIVAVGAALPRQKRKVEEFHDLDPSLD